MPKLIVVPYCGYYTSPIGTIEINNTQQYVTGIRFLSDNEPIHKRKSNTLTEAVIAQLDEYFKGIRKRFDFAKYQEGTPFEQRVWQQVEQIDFAKTASYGLIARELGDENQSRAVGNANGKNKLAIVVPCHRVIGVDGSLTGYAWGTEKKQWLLDHEQKIAGTYLKLF
jgi:methylated-DNA-[protein]-cysteine S-methyltransferase